MFPDRSSMQTTLSHGVLSNTDAQDFHERIVKYPGSKVEENRQVRKCSLSNPLVICQKQEAS